MDLTTPGYRELRSAFRLAFDPGDPWGSMLSWWFGVAEILHHTDPSKIPASWEFRDAPAHEGTDLHDYPDLDEYPDSEIADLVHLGTVTADDLLAFGTVITRYGKLLQAAGLDY